MCEHFIARSTRAFRLDELWPFAEKLERFGIAGFGWGAAWIDAAGRLDAYRDVRAFRDDPGRARIGAIETTSALVHLRRPSRLSTLTIHDTQPFADPAGRFAFSHNGDFRATSRWRKLYRSQGRIHGRADTEVGQRWLEDSWGDSAPPGAQLRALHETLGGQANLALLTADGGLHAYAGNTENPVFAFRLDEIAIVSTGIYSLDRSLFRLVAPEARDRRLIRVGGVVELGPGGVSLAPLERTRSGEREVTSPTIARHRSDRHSRPRERIR